MRRSRLISSSAALLFIVAGCAGESSPKAQEETAIPQSQSPDLEMLVGRSFQKFVSSLVSYTEIEPDTENPLSKFDETEAAFLSLRSDYVAFKRNLSQVSTQDELGRNGPALGKMRDLLAFADRYIETQEIFYNAVSVCADLPGGLSSPDCDFGNLTSLESDARDAIGPFLEAMDAVMASIPQNND